MKAEIWVDRNKKIIENRLKFIPEENIYVLYSKDIKPDDRIETLISLFKTYFNGHISRKHFDNSIFIFYPENEEDQNFISKVKSVVELDSNVADVKLENKPSVVTISESKYEIILMKGDFILTLRSKGEEVSPFKEKLYDFLDKLGE